MELTMPGTGSCSLYRHYDEEGRLLYVGVSLAPISRLREHRYQSRWFYRISVVKIEHFATRAEAVSAEVTAIETEEPMFNTVHVPRAILSDNAPQLSNVIDMTDGIPRTFQAWEDRMRKRPRPTHPGAILREDVLPALGITQIELADRLGVSRLSVSELLHEKRAVSPEMALRLGKLLDTTPESWLNMQTALSIWEARQLPEILESVKPFPKAKAS